jgi:magnesium-transporting ATPase (P-type)
VSLVLANLMLIVINLSWSKNIHRILLSANKILFIVFAGAISCLFVVLYVPFFADLFRLAPLNAKDFLLIGVTVFASLAWFEVLKLLKNKTKLQLC